MVKTLRDFVLRIDELDRRGDISDAYYVFEEECTDNVRSQLWLLADMDSNEPFRSALINMGFANY